MQLHVNNNRPTWKRGYGCRRPPRGGEGGWPDADKAMTGCALIE